MKRALVLSLVAVLALSMTAFGFFGFGYTHGIPDNYGKVWAGFEFGPDASAFNVDIYLADMWGIQTESSLMCLGVDAFYVGETDLIDVEVGTYFESTPLVGWPTVSLGTVGFYGDMTLHVLAPSDTNSITWDLFASFNLDVVDVAGPGTQLVLDAEIGFEVEL